MPSEVEAEIGGEGVRAAVAARARVLRVERRAVFLGLNIPKKEMEGRKDRLSWAPAGRPPGCCLAGVQMASTHMLLSKMSLNQFSTCYYGA